MHDFGWARAIYAREKLHPCFLVSRSNDTQQNVLCEYLHLPSALPRCNPTRTTQSGRIPHEGSPLANHRVPFAAPTHTFNCAYICGRCLLKSLNLVAAINSSFKVQNKLVGYPWVLILVLDTGFLSLVKIIQDEVCWSKRPFCNTCEVDRRGNKYQRS
jgi:hypothetical protein